MPTTTIISVLLAAQVATSTPTDTPAIDAPPPPAPEVSNDQPMAVPADEPAAAEEPAEVAEPAEVEAPPEIDEAKEEAQEVEKDADVNLRSDDFFHFSDFADTRVTFSLSNVDVFASPGDRTTPPSGYRIGIDGDYNLFLENINTRFSGFESLSHIVVHKKVASFFTYWETEIALAALMLADTGSGQFRFFDSGTYVRLIRKLGDGPESEVGSIDLTAWPVSADRYRLGYTYLISWGGTSIFPGKLQSSSITEGAVPGFRLRWRGPGGKSYAHAGFKTSLLLSRTPGSMAGELVPNYGLLAGVGFDIADMIVLEANGGYFQKGTQERPGLEGSEIAAYGASARATIYFGSKPSNSADFRLYRNDPTDPNNFNLWKGYKPGTGFSVSVEGNYLAQNLEDPDNFGSERIVPAIAAGLVAKAKLDALGLRLDAFFQNTDFILFNVPGFVPFQATPELASTTPDIFAAATIDYFLDSLHMRPMISLGVKIPATYRGVVPEDQGPMVGGARPGERRTQVIVDEPRRTVLPPNTDATPIFAALLRVPVALSPVLALSAEVLFELDDNKPRIAQDNERGEVTYIFDPPQRLGFSLSLQSRW